MNPVHYQTPSKEKQEAWYTITGEAKRQMPFEKGQISDQPGHQYDNCTYTSI